MADQYLGEIRMFGGSFAPQGWAFCNGQLLSIAENSALFALIGTRYGGDGQTTFGVPDLRGRVAMHVSSTHPLGPGTGTETVTVNMDQLPAHTHMAQAALANGDTPAPEGKVWAAQALNSFATDATGSVAMNVAALQPQGGNQPHDNLMPFQVISFIIALEGIFPSTD